MQKEYPWNGPKDRRQKGKSGDTANRICIYQIEPEDVADECNDDALKQYGGKDQDIYMTDGCFPEEHAQGKKDRNRKNRLIKEGMMMSYLSHKSLPDIDRGDRPQDGCHEGKQIPRKLGKWGNSQVFAQEDDDADKW